MSMLTGSAQKRQAKAQEAAMQRQAAEQAAQFDQLREQQKIQADAVADRDARTAAAERAQQRVRLGRRRGLLTYTDDQVMGGA